MTTDAWKGFVEACGTCTRCGLSATRTHVVIGRGTAAPVPVLFVGEGPGEQEDLQGKAFVGRAGQLLDLLLAAHQFPGDSWYIANIVKCRPPGNREPSDEEAAACMPWLRWQVKTLKPRIIVCLGRVASKHLIDKDIRITAARGNWVERQGFWMMPTWHPAAVLRDPAKRADLYLDLEKVRERMDG
jgi:uracil-DNA glycosylase